MISIYIAEDDKFLSNAYRFKLEKSGYSVTVLDDGEELMDALNKKIPDIIILDLVMPLMDGFVVLEKLKSNEKLKKIPVIIASNLSEKSDVKKGLDMGADDYIIKTEVSIGDILNKVEKLLNGNF